MPKLPHALFVAAVMAAPGLRAQNPTKPSPTPDLGAVIVNAPVNTAAKPAKPSPFWQSSVPFTMTLTVNFKKISDNCLGRTTIAFGPCQDQLDKAPWEPATVTYADSGSTITLPARVRARGISRLRLCDLIPPLWVDFKSADTKKRVFEHLNRFKLVMPCKAAPEYERYTIEEYNLYRLHALMTPTSHLTRLIRLTVVDSSTKKVQFTKYAFAVEDIQELATRLGGERITTSTPKASDLQMYQTALVGMLQYMIGNTDFSITALHNAELVRLDGAVYPVANDFDQAGVINPPYAKPDPRLGIKSVTERLYRGMCVPPDTIAHVLTVLREKRAAITALYTDDIGKLIGGTGTKESIKWFDDFYADMAKPALVKSQILDKCQPVR